MKKLVKSIVLVVAIVVGSSAIAQNNVKKEAVIIQLTQTPGEFDQKELNLKAGETYVFEVSNKGIDHAVGFVLAPEGKTNQENHVKNAYVQKMIEDGQTQHSKEVVLEKGKYVFFCPMNPTPEYKITVN